MLHPLATQPGHGVGQGAWATGSGAGVGEVVGLGSNPVLILAVTYSQAKLKDQGC